MALQLSENYVPKRILFRDKELNELREVFNNFEKWKVGTNIALLGVTGSGKTTLLKQILKEKDNSVYISCLDTKSPCNTIKKICNSKKRTFSDVQSETVNMLKANPKIIILDEIDKVSNLTELFNCLNYIYRETQVPIIIATLKRDIIQKLPIDARNTLFFEKISLPSYNVSQLKDIILERISEMSIKINIDDGALNYICALSGRQGSARVLIKLLLGCLQKDNFKQEFINSMFVRIMKEEMFGFIDDLNPTEREFINNIIVECGDSGEVKSCELEKLMNLTPGRISQLANIFEKYGVIASRIKNLGRMGGRQRYIKFISKEIFEDFVKIGKF